MRKQVDTAECAPGVNSVGYEVESNAVAAWFMRWVLRLPLCAGIGVVSLKVNGKLTRMKRQGTRERRKKGTRRQGREGARARGREGRLSGAKKTGNERLGGNLR